MEVLKCPVCNKEHRCYRDYFQCWTSHLTREIQFGRVPVSHDEAVKYYYKNPQAIEEGMRSVGCEVGVFRGKIDLILRDRQERLCLVDVTVGKDAKRKINQLKRYKKNLKWLANHVFKCNLKEPIRLFVVHPGKYVKEVKVK